MIRTARRALPIETRPLDVPTLLRADDVAVNRCSTPVTMVPDALSPDQVVARSQPRPLAASSAAAHFELAVYLWQTGQRDPAIEHFNASHRLAPDSWTYKRQARSLVGRERVGGEYGRWVPSPVKGEEADWPFESDFTSNLALLGEGEYYPRAL